MDYRLALDIGTASCGLIVLSLDGNREPVAIAHHSLSIFSEPVLPHAPGEAGEPKKTKRRRARRARRLRRIAQLADLIGLDHKAIPADAGQLIHILRAKSASMQIGLDDLLRVLLKLAKRRGYAGGFKIKTDKQKDDDTSIVKPGIEKLEAAMQAADCKTVGQYLQHRFKNSETLKLKEVGLYSHRDMLIAEFNAIWDEQEKHHAVLRESCPDPAAPVGTQGPSTHAIGGTRMGDNKATNTCDRWGFAHEVPNLGVMGGSVMGTSGARNPTLTIQALSWRTAERLAQQWKSMAT